MFGLRDKTVCGNCNEAIGSVADTFIEAGPNRYHRQCFKCMGCKAKLARNCLNVADKSYCEKCGHKAFVNFYVRK